MSAEQHQPNSQNDIVSRIRFMSWQKQVALIILVALAAAISLALIQYGRHVLSPNRYGAVQHNLAGIIAALDSVESARVIIASGSEQGTLAAPGIPSASIFINPAGGKSVTGADLKTITALVTQTIENLSPSSVHIYDQQGAELDSSLQNQFEQPLSAPLLQQQYSLENRLEKRIAETVNTLIGSGRALIQVSVLLNNSESENTTELYNPDSATVKSEHTEYAPGSRYSVPDPTAQVQYIPPIPTTSSVDYEINRTVNKTVKPAGAIERISVSILISGNPEDKVYEPVRSLSITPNELQSIKTAVASVISMQPDRGDTITVIPVPHHEFESTQHKDETTGYVPLELVMPILKILLMIAGFICVYLLIIKPILNILSAEPLSEQIPEPSEKVDHDDLIDDTQKEEDFTHVLKSETIRNPASTAHIIKNWLQET